MLQKTNLVFGCEIPKIEKREKSHPIPSSQNQIDFYQFAPFWFLSLSERGNVNLALFRYEESYEKAMKAYEMLLDLFRNIYNEYPNEKINQ